MTPKRMKPSNAEAAFMAEVENRKRNPLVASTPAAKRRRLAVARAYATELSKRTKKGGKR